MHLFPHEIFCYWDCAYIFPTEICQDPASNMASTGLYLFIYFFSSNHSHPNLPKFSKVSLNYSVFQLHLHILSGASRRKQHPTLSSALRATSCLRPLPCNSSLPRQPSAAFRSIRISPLSLPCIESPEIYELYRLDQLCIKGRFNNLYLKCLDSSWKIAFIRNRWESLLFLISLYCQIYFHDMEQVQWFLSFKSLDKGDMTFTDHKKEVLSFSHDTAPYRGCVSFCSPFFFLNRKAVLR